MCYADKPELCNNDCVGSPYPCDNSCAGSDTLPTIPHCQGCEIQRTMKANALSTAKLARVLSEGGLDGLAAYIRENTSQNNQ